MVKRPLTNFKESFSPEDLVMPVLHEFKMSLERFFLTLDSFQTFLAQPRVGRLVSYSIKNSNPN